MRRLFAREKLAYWLSSLTHVIRLLRPQQKGGSVGRLRRLPSLYLKPPGATFAQSRLDSRAFAHFAPPLHRGRGARRSKMIGKTLEGCGFKLIERKIQSI